jgi:hypothetical protein
MRTGMCFRMMNIPAKFGERALIARIKKTGMSYGVSMIQRKAVKNMQKNISTLAGMSFVFSRYQKRENASRNVLCFQRGFWRTRCCAKLLKSFKSARAVRGGRKLARNAHFKVQASRIVVKTGAPGFEESVENVDLCASGASPVLAQTHEAVSTSDGVRRTGFSGRLAADPFLPAPS